MEKFKAEIQSRNKRVVLAASIIFFVYIYLSRKTGVPDAMNDLVAGYNLGLLIALQVGAIYFIPRFYVSTSKSIIKALINMRSFEIQLSPIGWKKNAQKCVELSAFMSRYMVQ